MKKRTQLIGITLIIIVSVILCACSTKPIIEKIDDFSTETEYTYQCNDYFGSLFTVVYTQTKLISVNNDPDQTKIESERLADYYNGNIDLYISIARGFCSDEN